METLNRDTDHRSSGSKPTGGNETPEQKGEEEVRLDYVNIVTINDCASSLVTINTGLRAFLVGPYFRWML